MHHPQRLLAPFVLALAACGGGADPASSSDGSESASTAAAAPANFVKVADGIYRGAHPTAAGMKYLKSIGVRTIVDLEIDDMVEATPNVILQEEYDAWKANITVERRGMSAFAIGVSDEFEANVDAILATLKDSSKKPIYVHCKHGQDRTGLVIGLERVLLEGWPVDKAHDEMVRLGFHTEFLGLEEFYERKTGGVQP